MSISRFLSGAVACCAALLLFASPALADSGVLLPGDDVRIGNLHVANLPGAGGNVNWFDNGRALALVVHDDAYCAVLKRGDGVQARRVFSLTLGGGYYAQANVSGARITVLGDHAVALALAIRKSHVNNANTIELAGNGNIAAAVRWNYGRGEVSLNRIRFGVSPLLSGSRNDAYLSGDREGTFDLAWANRTLDVAGTANTTIAFDGFPRPVPAVDAQPADLAPDALDLRKDRSDGVVAAAVN